MNEQLIYRVLAINELKMNVYCIPQMYVHVWKLNQYDTIVLQFD